MFGDLFGHIHLTVSHNLAKDKIPLSVAEVDKFTFSPIASMHGPRAGCLFRLLLTKEAGKLEKIFPEIRSVSISCIASRKMICAGCKWRISLPLIGIYFVKRSL